MKKLLATALFAAAAAALTGCASSKKARAAREANPAPCPNILILNEASRFIEFDGEESADNIAYSGEMVDVTSTCRYYADEPIEAGITMDLAFGRGPKGEEDEKLFTYFVAVTRKDSEVIAKKEFQIPVKFSEDEPIQVEQVDIDKVEIPRAGENISGLNFEIIVGFSVTPKQAIFNRSGKSLKFPDLK
ncbi:hypothetical protein [Hyphococcus luteus]|jgi:hypothetical protein|uniref:DUF4352 domain-containing protein n=1 Tax=Hyphococcus luteus TaxID=2058213 RepID=A0A2S7K4Y8_9PROT|nr:hypothetical protein [Marinicaulis flavus]PQA87541.1 hypothetical protein CW354_12140 [Marinicaulis flavus]